MREAHKSLKPGGWLEFHEAVVPPFISGDNSLAGTHLETWGKLVIQGAERLGQDWMKARNYRHWMEATGFVDIQTHECEWPINPLSGGNSSKGKNLGLCLQDLMKQQIHGWGSSALQAGLNWSDEEEQVLTALAVKDIFDNKVCAYMKVYASNPQPRRLYFTDCCNKD